MKNETHLLHLFRVIYLYSDKYEFNWNILPAAAAYFLPIQIHISFFFVSRIYEMRTNSDMNWKHQTHLHIETDRQRQTQYNIQFEIN